MKRFAACILFTSAVLAADSYRVLHKIKIGGSGGWDYLTIDNATRRLYASHGTSVAVVDLDKSAVVTVITGLKEVHGIALAPDLGKGFITDGESDAVFAFDLKSLKVVAKIGTRKGPDAICYEPKSRRVFTFNTLDNSTVIDAVTNTVVGTVELGGRPEFCASNGAGKLYVNVADTREIVEIDSSKPEVVRRTSISPCENPSGLAIDLVNGKLFSACSNNIMAITDIKSMAVVATPPIGSRPDGAAYDPGAGLAFSSNGDATLTIIGQVNGKWDAVGKVETGPRSRTIAVDVATHRLYLPGAEYGVPAGRSDDQGKRRPEVLPDTFHILVVGK
jgi:YVTN family beta-propeller protein